MTASTNNVYIGSIPRHLPEHELRTLFASFGEIQSCKLMMDAATGASKGFGFVQFREEHAAADAVAQMNGSVIEGSALEVRYADRSKNAPKIYKQQPPTYAAQKHAVPAPTAVVEQRDNVYVTGVPPTWMEQEVKTYFSTYGEIQSCKVLKNMQTGASKGAALVRYHQSFDAAVAIQTLNGYTLSTPEFTSTLQVSYANKPGGPTTSATQLRPRYEPYGKPGQAPQPAAQAASVAIPMAHIRTPKNIPQMSAAAFRTPTNSVQQQQQQQYGAEIVVPQRLDVMPEEGANLYIYGLDSGVTDLHLYKAFGPYGAVKSVRVIMDENGGPKGYGFVQFFTTDEAQAAMAALNGVTVGAKTWTVNVHIPRQKRA